MNLPEVGNWSLNAAVLAAACAVSAAVASIRLDADKFLRIARWAIAAFTAALTVASIALLVALLQSDFRLDYVANYTERALPIGYKIAAFWAGQQGSLLLWAWLLGVVATMHVMIRRKDRGVESAITIATLAVVCGFFACLMLFAESQSSGESANPFKVLPTAAADGHGLNPLLQDPAMIAHPPILFLGYAGFTIPFAMMFGALAAGRTDNQWIGQTRRWVIASWLLLGVGILLGAEWAYVELGWGGYWAWDPVENASLLPWLTATALLHSIMIQQQRGMFKIWNVSLIALSFILCIFGTYLTRSGVIQSVHAFGESPLGTFFLVFLLLCVAATVAMTIWRRRQLQSEQQIEALISREGAFLATNVLLVVIMLTTVFGTILPLLSRLFMGMEKTAKPEFYNRIVVPMSLLLVALMSIGPLLAYGKDAGVKLARGIVIPGIVALIAVTATLVIGPRNIWALVCIAISVMAVTSIVVDFVHSLWFRIRSTGENVLIGALRLTDGNHRRYGGQLIHLGMILIVLGVAGSSLFTDKQMIKFEPGQTVAVGRYQLTYQHLKEVRQANFTAVEAHMSLAEPDGSVTSLHPQRRFYDKDDHKEEHANNEAAIRSTLRDDVYLTLAAWSEGGQITTIEVRVNPLVQWIWLGGVVLSIGGLFCLVPRFVRRPHPADEPAADRLDIPVQSEDMTVNLATCRTETPS